MVRLLVGLIMILVLFAVVIPSRVVSSIGGIDYALMAMIGIIAFPLLIFIFVGRKGKMPATRFATSWTIFVLYVVVQSIIFYARGVSISWKGIFWICSPGFIGLAVIVLSRPNGDLRAIQNSFIIGALISLILGIVVAIAPGTSGQILGWSVSEALNFVGAGIARARSTFGAPGPTGMLAAIILTLSSERLGATRNPGRIGTRLALFVSAACLLLSQSRAAIIAYLAGGVIIPFLKRPSRKVFRVLALVGFIALVFVCYGITDFQRVYSIKFHAAASSDALRWTSLKAAAGLFLNSPLFGVGVGSVYPRDGLDEPIIVKGIPSAREPHNLYLLLLSELGLIGFVLYSIAIAQLLRGPRNERYGFRTRVSCGAWSCSLQCLLVYSLFESSVFISSRMGVVYGLLIGLSQVEWRCPPNLHVNDRRRILAPIEI